jgi:gas vesicle protein
MKSNVLFSLLFGLSGGAVGGIVATMSGAPAGGDAGGDAVAEVATLRETVERLSARNDELVSRLDQLENRPVVSESPTRVDADESKAGVADDLAPELRELVASLRSKERGLPEDMVAEIAQVVTDLEAKKEAERREEQKKRDAERLEERLAEMAKELELSPFQVNEMRKVLTSLEEKRDAMRDQMRDGPTGDWEKMRATFDQLRTETRTELSKFLNGDQLKKYEDNYGNRGFGGRGGFGGRSNRGPGDGAAPSTAANGG